MDLKNAAAVCLISLFSATLVVLIARALDSQAAAQLEPQLASIVEELRAIRKQGGIATAPGTPAEHEPVSDGLVVYYFHSDTRCPNCEAVEAVTKQLLETEFAPQLRRGEIAWKVLNYQKPAGEKLARKFGVADPVVVLAWLQDGEVREGWQRLSGILGLANDKAVLAQFVREKIQNMLLAEKERKAPKPTADPPKVPVPPADAAKDVPPKKPPDIPIPIPIPD